MIDFALYAAHPSNHTLIGDITRSSFDNITEDYHNNRVDGPWMMFQVNDLVGISHIGFNPLTDCNIHTVVMFQPQWDKVDVYGCMCEVDGEVDTVYPLTHELEMQSLVQHNTFTLDDVAAIGGTVEQRANNELLRRHRARHPDYDDVVKRTQAHIEGELQSNAALQMRLAACEARVAALEAENTALRSNARAVFEKEENAWDKMIAAAVFGKK